jgi:beta-glucosidase
MEDGVLSKEIMPDYLHPNGTGYKIWAEAIEPKVAELMGQRP